MSKFSKPMKLRTGPSHSDSSLNHFDGQWFDELDDDTRWPCHIAFNARYFSEEIEGRVLYVEKYCKEKIKTLTVALVICLNIDIDPPDVQKIPPFCRMEAWFDPTDANSLRALETIGKNLQIQYERWQPRARYRQCLDPTLDDVKKLCVSLRRNAKEDRILFHYNGHGVPRPTENGEIWVFNAKFTKYIPLSLYDLQRWLGAPSVYVFDCQNAGRVIRMYENFCHRRLTEQTMAAAAQRQQQQQQADVGPADSAAAPHGDGATVPRVDPPNNALPTGGGVYANAEVNKQKQQQQPQTPGMHIQGAIPQLSAPLVTMENTIMLAACREDEDLPQNPELPADLFTACLTTPIRMALRWHWLRHQEHFPGYLDEALLDRIPGSHSNRMSLLGEVNWIFTAVTDTIAWCCFPIDIFQKLFRQDLLVASLFRNFLLAERIMKTYGCTPVSAPALLPTFRHPMWNAWDHALDRVIHYLPRMLKIIEGSPLSERKLPIVAPGNGLYQTNTQASTASAIHSANVEQHQSAVTNAVLQRSNSQQQQQQTKVIGMPSGGTSGLHTMQAPVVRVTAAHEPYRPVDGHQLTQQAYFASTASSRLHPSGYEKHPGASNAAGPTMQSTNRGPSVRPTVIPQIPVRPVTVQAGVWGGEHKPQTDVIVTTGVAGAIPPGFVQQQKQIDSSGVLPHAVDGPISRRVVTPQTAKLDPVSEKVVAQVGPGAIGSQNGAHRVIPDPSEIQKPGQPDRSTVHHVTTKPTEQVVNSKVNTNQLVTKGDVEVAVPMNDPLSAKVVPPNEATETPNAVPPGDPKNPAEHCDNLKSSSNPSSSEALKDTKKVTFSDDDEEENDEQSEDDDEDEEDTADDEITGDSDEVEEEEDGNATIADEVAKVDKIPKKTTPHVRVTSSLEQLQMSKRRLPAAPCRTKGVSIKQTTIAVARNSSSVIRRCVSCPVLTGAASGRRREPSKNKHGTRGKPSMEKAQSPPKTNSDLVVVDKPLPPESSTKPNDQEHVVADVPAPPVDKEKTAETVVSTAHPPVSGQEHPTETTHGTGQLRRQQHGLEQLYTLQAQVDAQTIMPSKVAPKNLTPVAERPACPPRPQPKMVITTGAEQVSITVTTVATQAAHEPPPVVAIAPPTTLVSLPPAQQLQQPQSTQPSTTGTTVSSGSSVPAITGSVIGGSGPASFFTSQMTAFKVWLQTADEKQPPATQLPILLQILLSQSHRIRAMQLLSEFLDLGPWAVTHCLMVGILPYIVRLFHSPVAEVKPHLVFIWGKIIASAQTEFGRNDSIRDFGYKYFIACLNDTDNLSPLTRTITAFALAKMLEKEPHGESDTFFQDVYLKQNFIPLVLSQLYENPPDSEVEIYVRLRLWLIFALAKVWRNNDEARWFGVRYNVTEVLFTYLDDVSPEVRAATVYALGTLISNRTTDASKQDHADQVSHQVGARLVKVAYLDASWLVRCELAVMFAGLARQFEVQLCAMALCNLQDTQSVQHNPTNQPPTGRAIRHSTTGPTNIYAQFWHALVHLAHDPHPEVSRMGRKVLDFILSKVTIIPDTSHVSSPVSPISYSSKPDQCDPSTGSHLLPNAALNPSQSVAGSLTSTQGGVIQPQKTDAKSYIAPTQQSPNVTDVKCSSYPNQTITDQGTQSTSVTPVISATMPHCTNVRITSSVTTGLSSTSVVRTSAFLVHSAYFPSRRHHMVDHLLRETVGDHHPATISREQPQHLATATPNNPVVPSVTVASTESHPLDVVKTQLFAWSCRWFTQPLLVKYGGFIDPPGRAGYTGQSIDTDGQSTCDSLVIPRRCAFLNPELAALGAVSVDTEAVAYADRLTRMQQHHEAVRSGRLRWTEMIGSRDRFGASGTVRSNHTNSDVGGESNVIMPMEPGFLTTLSAWHITSEPTVVRFHPHQPHLVVADSTGLTVCSLKGLEPLSRLDTPDENYWFTRLTAGSSNSSVSLGRVTDIRFINPSEERGLLLTAHNDGRLRVWRNYIRDLGQDSEIVTAWTGLNDLLPSTHQAGLVVHWSQATTQLAVGGDARMIRLWDCERESRLRDIPTGADACVTVLARSPDLRLLAAGFGDGVVKAFDLRMPHTSSLSHHSDSHIFSSQCDSGWIHDVQFSMSGRLYAAGYSGGVAVWAWSSGASVPTTHTRQTDSKRIAQPPKLSNTTTTPVTSFPAGSSHFRRLSHPRRLSIPAHTPVHCSVLKVDLPATTSHIVAAGIGGMTREIRIHRIHDGSVHSVMKPNSTPVTIALHPNEPLVAFGSKDKSVTLLKLEARRTSRA